MEQNNTSIEYEISPLTQKGKANLPSEGVNDLLKATARLIDTVCNGAECVGTMLKNSTNVLGKPIEALIQGKTNEIELANQFITARLTYVKETNATMHVAYIAEEFNEKVKLGEEIPEKIEESDKLYKIQGQASEVSNEEFLKLWAKLYVEEACNPNTVSKKTINILGDMDYNIVKILEKEIFPYCDYDGFYFGNQVDVSKLMIAMDYGIIDNFAICQNPRINAMWKSQITDTLTIFCYPNYAYSSSRNGLMYKLTTSGLEIYKILKINKTKEILDIIFKNIEEASKSWGISNQAQDKIRNIHPINPNEKFVICDNNNNIIYPLNSQYKNIDEFYINTINNFEVVQNDK